MGKVGFTNKAKSLQVRRAWRDLAPMLNQGQALADIGVGRPEKLITRQLTPKPYTPIKERERWPGSAPPGRRPTFGNRIRLQPELDKKFQKGIFKPPQQKTD